MLCLIGTAVLVQVQKAVEERAREIERWSAKSPSDDESVDTVAKPRKVNINFKIKPA